MFTIALLALLQDFDESLQCLTGVRTSLSTRQGRYRGLVNVGAGLPTQQNGWGLHPWLSFVTQDVFFEFCSFSWGHRLEEGLHPSHLCFGWFLVSRARAVSGVMSFLLTPITYSSYVYSVLPARCVSRFCGAQSTSLRVSH